MGIGTVMRIKIAPPYLQRIKVEFMGNGVNRPLDAQHTLRATKAAKGRIGLCMRLAAM